MEPVPISSLPLNQRDDLRVPTSQPYNNRITFPRLLKTNNAFLQHIETQSDHVMQYEDKKLQDYARDIVPKEKLKLNAIERIRKTQKTIKSGKFDGQDPFYEDMFLVELTNWFNTDFFLWIDSVPCTLCGNDNSRSTGIHFENYIRVETYTCCGKELKFQRYNDISYLLKTRRGRCGEFANCFTFICRALGYEARIVMATFDHVWTEVYSEGQKRWLHIDPSDNVIDAPLMYQYGWKRSIDYVIAYNRFDVQDVSFRYSNEFDEVIA